MKYKKQIATSALALSLLIGGSSVFAATPQDLGIKNTHLVYQKQNKDTKRVKTRRKNVVGIISAINSTGFIVEVKNAKTNKTSSVDVKTDIATSYRKNGVKASAIDLAVGQKVVVVGSLDKTTNIITAVKVTIKN